MRSAVIWQSRGCPHRTIAAPSSCASGAIVYLFLRALRIDLAAYIVEKARAWPGRHGMAWTTLGITVSSTMAAHSSRSGGIASTVLRLWVIPCLPRRWPPAALEQWGGTFCPPNVPPAISWYGIHEIGREAHLKSKCALQANRDIAGRGGGGGCNRELLAQPMLRYILSKTQ